METSPTAEWAPCVNKVLLYFNEMAFILDRVHSTSIYFSAFVCMIPERHFVPVQVILVFIPNEDLVLVQILVSCKLKTNFVTGFKSQMV